MKKVLLIWVLIVNNIYAQNKTVFDIARTGTVQEMEVLVKQDKNCVNQINDNKSSPLILACYRGNTAVANYLMTNGADINYNSGMGTALMATVVKGNIELVHDLLKNNADLNLADANGTTALMYAIQFQNINITAILLEHKADKTIKNKDGKTAFELAIFTNNEKLINLFK